METPAVFILLTSPIVLFAAEPPNQCSVTLVRGEEEKVLGNFEAKLAEETETIKTFPIPGTKLKAMVSVYYTDESIRIQVSPKYVQDTSIRIALGLTDKDDDSVLISPDASVAEAAIVSNTEEKNLLRVLKVGSTSEGKFAVVAECRSK